MSSRSQILEQQISGKTWQPVRHGIRRLLIRLAVYKGLMNFLRTQNMYIKCYLSIQIGE